MKSMTGYGRKVKAFSLGQMSIELQSVNRRHLEIVCYLPKILLPFEIEIRQFLQEKIYRGHVTLRSLILFNEVSPIEVKPNLALASQIKTAWDQLADHLGVQEKFSLSLLANSSEIFSHDVNPELGSQIKQDFLEGLEEAFSIFDKMRQEEGRALEKDKLARIKILQQSIDEIEAKAPNAVEKNRKKLFEKLKEVLDVSVTDERVLKEVALFAEKVDITEEIVRFRLHLKELEKVSQGKNIEFLIQELGRETNTIGSKSQDYEISSKVVIIKGELDRLKEQAQNVE